MTGRGARLSASRRRWFTLAFALALAFLSGPGAASSRADTMRWTPSRPEPALPAIEAVLLPAPSESSGVELVRRLGFASLFAAGNAWTITARLGNAALVWYDPATFLRFGLARPIGVAPVVGHRPPARASVLPVAFWEDVPAAGMPHPNGAKSLIGITAVTDRLDTTCERWWTSSPGGHPAFGPVVAEPRLGAASRSCTVWSPNGTAVRVRILQPTDRAGIAARLLGTGGPRWVGVTIAVEDVALEARRFARVGVRATLMDVGTPGGPLLRVDPRDAAGALIEFVPHAPSVARPRGTR